MQKQCTNKTCYMHGTKIDTAVQKCIACGKTLVAGSLMDFDKLLGDLGNIFKEGQ